ncbi:MAG: hypothetical protein QXN23_02530 [Candidatus Caldarchaeum sp.]|uniref:Homoserine kinase n=1 Tax=Caldiarchaeum subterraneum TaxID=311458 RepID=A0A7C4I0H6_CALS0
MVAGVFEAPASSANLGPGYDVFSLALEKPRLRLSIVAENSDDVEVELKAIGRYCSEIPVNLAENAAAKAAEAVLRYRKICKKLSLTIDASIPPRKGLGASGAEAAAAVYGLNTLLELGLTREEMVELASTAEPGQHADNVAASLLGGFIIAHRDEFGFSVLSLKPPENLGAVLIIPDVKKESTAAAREAVPQNVSTSVHVKIAAETALAAAAIARGDVDLFLRAVLVDPLVEPARADAGVYGRGYDARKLLREKLELYKGFGVAMVISGAGPSRLLLFNRVKNTGKVGGRPVDKAVEKVVQGLDEEGIKVLEILETFPDTKGCVKIS